MEDDVVGLHRVVAGHDTEVCDLCGQAGAAVSMERIEGVRSLAGPVDYLRVCRDCRDLVERGEILLDGELATGPEGADD